MQLVVRFTASVDAVYRAMKRAVYWTGRLSRPCEPMWDAFCAWRWRWWAFTAPPVLWLVVLVAPG